MRKLTQLSGICPEALALIEMAQKAQADGVMPDMGMLCRLKTGALSREEEHAEEWTTNSEPPEGGTTLRRAGGGHAKA